MPSHAASRNWCAAPQIQILPGKVTRLRRIHPPTGKPLRASVSVADKALLDCVQIPAAHADTPRTCPEPKQGEALPMKSAHVRPAALSSTSAASRPASLPDRSRPVHQEQHRCSSAAAWGQSADRLAAPRSRASGGQSCRPAWVLPAGCESSDLSERCRAARGVAPTGQVLRRG